MMLAAERRDLMMARLRRDGKVVAKDLATELGLSEDSVRRHLRELAAAGLCQRVYGGAMLASPASGTHASRSVIAPESKKRVGARAAYLIAPGSTVILDGGTTALEVVAALRPDLSATIITQSPTTAAALLDCPGIDVFILGGKLNSRSACAYGTVAAEAARSISADLYLLAPTGLHEREGITNADPDEAAMRRILIGRAADTFVMCSLDKLGTVAPYPVTGVSEVAGIVTDAPSYHPAIQQLEQQGVNILQAS
jgi:DeoR/GlpR family transcriptional regulator of sugar metabolism